MKNDRAGGGLPESVPETTSDKIRALGLAGHKRADIARLLGVRYQHVRNVLLKAGITTGLRNEVEVEREPIAVKAPAARTRTISVDALKASGFNLVGEWVAIPDIGIQMTTRAPTAPGVYVFVVDGTIAYVGLSNSGLRKRMDQYRRGHAKQRTSSRVKALIGDALASDHKVQVFVAMPDEQHWNALPVNTAAGLEAGLIQAIRPGWNILGAA